MGVGWGELWWGGFTLAPPLLQALVRGGHVSSIEGFHKWAKGGLKSCLLPPFLSLSPLPAHHHQTSLSFMYSITLA